MMVLRKVYLRLPITVLVLTIVSIGMTQTSTLAAEEADRRAEAECVMLLDEIKFAYVKSRLFQINKTSLGEMPSAKLWRWIDLYLITQCDPSEIAVTLASSRSEFEKILANLNLGSTEAK